jgi:hypothetical protein
MILAALYLVLFCFAVYKFSFLKDNILSIKFLYFIILLKVIGAFVYYGIYFCYYPVGFNGDSASTMHDAKVMYSALPKYPLDFIKMIFGIHSELDTDPLYLPYFKQIDKWGRADVSSNFFLNDNRTPIRLNALIMLFSFGYYSVHAVVMLIISFIGQLYLYKAFKKYFIDKEIILALFIFLSPSILFWTSGVLKEPVAYFLLGIWIYSFFKIFEEKNYHYKYFILLILSTLLFLILKPYVLILILTPFVIFSFVNKIQFKKIFSIASIYIFIFLALSTIGFIVLKLGFNKDVLQTIVVRQNDFINLSKGGYFFLNDEKYVRFEYDDTLHVELVDSKKQLYKLKPNCSYIYWNPHNLVDTMFVQNNQDTSLYQLISRCTPSGSSFYMERLQYTFSSFAKLVPIAFFNVLSKPFFYNANSVLELLASIENLFFLIVFIFCFCYRKKINDFNFLFLCLSIIVSSFILIGLTTTVSGAIVRYKIPFIPFLLMIPLMYLDVTKLKELKIYRYFYN